jgi:hypothetical protein
VSIPCSPTHPRSPRKAVCAIHAIPEIHTPLSIDLSPCSFINPVRRARRSPRSCRSAILAPSPRHTLTTGPRQPLPAFPTPPSTPSIARELQLPHPAAILIYLLFLTVICDSISDDSILQFLMHYYMLCFVIDDWTVVYLRYNVCQ